MTKLQRENLALAVIDVQGKLSELMFRKEEIYTNLARMIQGAKVLEIPVIWLEQIPEKLGPTRPEIAELLEGYCAPIPKETFSACDNQEFMEALNAAGRSKMLLTGIESHICLYQTAVDLIRIGREVHAVADCISSRTEENRRIGLEKIKDAGGVLTTVETALFEIQKVARGQRFKELAGIVK
ncbi:MAG: hydrolase [Desulfobacterales bacterium]|nr:MAG: hydrolase [Desulfobacterales bacterium]